jgi:hypothetical protein
MDASHSLPPHTDLSTNLPTTTMVCDDKRKIIAYLWYLNALLSIAYVIVAIAAAANQKDLETASTNHAAGFAAIWSMLILFLIIVGGTVTMKRVCTRV